MTDTVDFKALQRLLDKEAIREACLRYTRGVDRHDEAIATQAYHADATDDHGTIIGDRDDFIRHTNDLHSRNWNIHHHYITNQTIDLDGDSAHVETYYLATLRRDDGMVDVSGGRYLDRFERREGHWAIADRVCLVEWIAQMTKPNVAMDPGLFLQGAWDRSDLSYQRPLRQVRPKRELPQDGSAPPWVRPAS